MLVQTLHTRHNLGLKTLHYTVREVAPYINWIYYFHAWGMEPRFASITDVHQCPSCRTTWVSTFPIEEQNKAREAMLLYDEATRQLREWADEPICHALFLLAEAYSEGDDIIIDHRVRLPFLRQQQTNRSGYTLCMSDFIRPNIEGTTDTIGLFATTVSQRSPLSLQFSTLSDRLAEATAEKLHEEVRRHYWGYAHDERLTMRELHNEQFQGIRPAVGYPSLPDHSINFILDELLHMSDIGITLTESGAMHPHSSVSGLMLSHPKAEYFAIGPIGDDQLADYSLRRGISIEQLRKFLAR